MAKFLIIENESTMAQSIAWSLEEAGHEADWKAKSSFKLIEKEVIDYLKAHDPIDFIVLDLHEGEKDVKEKLAGFEIYTAIINAGLRGRFKHLLVCSRWWEATGKDMEAPEYTRVKEFLAANNIPLENFLPKFAHRPTAILKRAKELLNPRA